MASCQPLRKSRILMSLVPKCHESATLLSIPYLKGCFLHKPLINGLLLKAMNAPERSQTMEAAQRLKRSSSNFRPGIPPLPFSNVLPERGGGEISRFSAVNPCRRNWKGIDLRVCWECLQFILIHSGLSEPDSSDAVPNPGFLLAAIQAFITKK